MAEVRFTGGFWGYFLKSILIGILCIITFGLAVPYYMYWFYKYFFSSLEIGGRTVRFTGSFGGYFLKSLGLFVLSVLTFGLLLPYFSYWNVKYFASNLEVA